MSLTPIITQQSSQKALLGGVLAMLVLGGVACAGSLQRVGAHGLKGGGSFTWGRGLGLEQVGVTSGTARSSIVNHWSHPLRVLPMNLLVFSVLLLLFFFQLFETAFFCNLSPPRRVELHSSVIYHLKEDYTN